MTREEGYYRNPSYCVDEKTVRDKEIRTSAWEIKKKELSTEKTCKHCVVPTSTTTRQQCRNFTKKKNLIRSSLDLIILFTPFTRLLNKTNISASRLVLFIYFLSNEQLPYCNRYRCLVLLERYTRRKTIFLEISRFNEREERYELSGKNQKRTTAYRLK